MRRAIALDLTAPKPQKLSRIFLSRSHKILEPNRSSRKMFHLSQMSVIYSCFSFHRFYAQKQNASRVLAIVWASVCPSVTLVICIKTVQAHHHHHRQPWAQCPLVSDAILTIAAHRCLSRAAWLNSCRVAPHHCSMSSDHSR